MEKSRSLTQSIVQDLGQAIVTGTYSADNPFPIEAELCKQYEVSRSVLREAVKMLTAKGLLNARPRQGTWVQDESYWNMLDPDVLRWLLERKFSIELLVEFTETRIAIEPEAAQLAAEKADPEKIADIEEAIARMEAAARGEDDPLLSDIAFHVAVLEASGNRFFQQLRDLIETALRISIRFTNQSKGVTQGDVEQHRNVALAISKRNPKRAYSLMKTLMEDTMEDIVKAKAAR